MAKAARVAGASSQQGARRPRFEFESLGTPLTILVDRRSYTTAPVGTCLNLAPGRTADFTAAGAARPGVTTMLGTSYPGLDFLGTDDVMTSAQTFAQTWSPTVGWGTLVFCPDFARGTFDTGWQNMGVVGDGVPGPYGGTYLKDLSGGSFGPAFRVQTYIGDSGGAKVAFLDTNLDAGTVAIEWFLSGGTLTIIDIYTGATHSVPCGAVANMTGAMRMGVGSFFYTGQLAHWAMANVLPTVAYRDAAKEKLRADFPPQYVIPATVSNLWGNDLPARALNAAGGPVNWSALSMLAIETDAPSVGLVTRENASTIAGYGDAAILQGTTSQKYGTTTVKQVAATPSPAATIRRDTGLCAGTGTGNRRYFAVGAPLSAGVGHHIEKLYVPAAYRGTTSVVSQPATGTICIDGYGGRLAADASDGIVVAAGVLSGTAPNIAARAAAAVRIALMGCNYALVAVGRNDRAAGTSAADFEVALAAVVDIIIASGILAANIKIVSNIKEISAFPNTEPATIGAYRTACGNVTTAKSLATLINGANLPAAFASMGVGAPQDGVHPMPDPETGEAELAAAIASFGTAGRLLVWTDSIFSGSTAPASWNAVRGVIGKARAARA